MTKPVMSDAEKLGEATDFLHVCRDILYQQAVLFRQIRKELKDQPGFVDSAALAGLGEREGEAWASRAEALLIEMGESLD